ncbi:MAG: hypothetical protein R3E79_61515 [Caldilineaceae bacterium]
MAGRVVVGAVTPEGTGDAYLQVHPAYRQLEAEMIDWAEAHLAAPTADGAQRQLEIFVYDYDTSQQALLAARGYTLRWPTVAWCGAYLAEHPLLVPSIAAGYACAAQPDELTDCQRIADLLNCLQP